MKGYTSVALLFYALTANMLASDDPILEQIAHQEKVLADKGIAAFFETARLERWSPPQVKSRWCIKNTPDKGEQSRLEASFKHGRHILSLLPQLAESNDKLDALPTVIRMAEFADWIGTEHCYGNALIAKRALDLATPQAGALLAAPGTPPEVLSVLQARLTPRWGDASFAADVLNNELKKNYFSGAKTYDDISVIWSGAVYKALEKKNPNWTKSLPNGFLGKLNPSAMPITEAELPFFLDDPIPPIPTTETLMNGKHHEVIVHGVEPANVSRLRDLLKFRLAIKTFPPAAMKSDFYPGLKGAFDEAWRRHYATTNTPKETSLKLGLAAWFTYDTIIQKQMRPDDESHLDQFKFPDKE